MSKREISVIALNLGGGLQNKTSLLETFIADYQSPDLIWLQEVGVPKHKKDDCVRWFPGYDAFTSLTTEKKKRAIKDPKGGVILLAKTSVGLSKDDVEIIIEGRMMKVSIRQEELAANLLFMYGPAEKTDQTTFWEQVREHYSKLDAPVKIVMGDLNAVITPSVDKWRATPKTNPSNNHIKAFRTWFEDENLVDLWTEKHPEEEIAYTFFRLDDNGEIKYQSRIDLMLGNIPSAEYVKKAEALPAEVNLASDTGRKMDCLISPLIASFESIEAWLGGNRSFLEGGERRVGNKKETAAGWKKGELKRRKIAVLFIRRYSDKISRFFVWRFSCIGSRRCFFDSEVETEEPIVGAYEHKENSPQRDQKNESGEHRIERVIGQDKINEAEKKQDQENKVRK